MMGRFPECFLPLILWMDKGHVSKHVKKHPILLRAAFLPRKIRNCSGNGGGVLIGYMPVVHAYILEFVLIYTNFSMIDW